MPSWPRALPLTSRRGNALGIDVGIEWESGNWSGFPEVGPWPQGAIALSLGPKTTRPAICDQGAIAVLKLVTSAQSACQRLGQRFRPRTGTTPTPEHQTTTPTTPGTMP